MLGDAQHDVAGVLPALDVAHGIHDLVQRVGARMASTRVIVEA